MVIFRRQHEVNRIPQSIHDSVQLCVQPASGSSNCLIRRFPPSVGTFVNLEAGRVQAQIFHIRICGQCAEQNFPCTIVPPFGKSGIYRLPWAGISRHCAPLRAIQSIPLSMFRSSFRGPASPPFPEAAALLCAPIVLLLIHTPSCPYFCTNSLAESAYHPLYVCRWKAVQQAGPPVVLDPVGAGASTLRTETALGLLKEIKFTVTRGNISEIRNPGSGQRHHQGRGC